MLTVLEMLQLNINLWFTHGFFLCKPLHSAPAHYHLAMHVCALLTTVSSVEQLDEMVQSAAVVFSSPCTGPNVEKHLHKLQSLMLKNGLPQYDDRKANIPIKSFEVFKLLCELLTVILE